MYDLKGSGEYLFEILNSYNQLPESWIIEQILIWEFQ